MSANALRNIVIGLGVLIVIAFAVAVWGIVTNSQRTGNGATVPEVSELDLGLPGECEILSASADGERLVVVTGGAVNSRDACARSYVIDLQGGAVRLTVRP